MQAWADPARYTPADQMLVLTGSPRVINAGMATTAKSIRINRATGDALADGDVKSTYSELKEQPDGALLASSSPIHVTAHTMTAHSSPGVALYSGKARLWQDANIIEAPSIQFDREHRSVTAQGTATQPVSTILLQPEKAQAQKVQPQHSAEEILRRQSQKRSPEKRGRMPRCTQAHLNHRSQAHLRGCRTQSPLRRRRRRQRSRLHRLRQDASMRISWLEGKPRPINRLPGPDNSIAWWPRVTS